MQAEQLEELLYKEIPITQALRVSVKHLSEKSISIAAPIAENKNVHNTAFAGSIFTTATLAGWSLLTNYLQENSIKASVVMAEGSIKYKKPINGDILAQSEMPASELIEEFIQRFQAKGRARMELVIDLVEDDRVKAQLTGQFAAIGT